MHRRETREEKVNKTIQTNTYLTGSGGGGRGRGKENRDGRIGRDEKTCMHKARKLLFVFWVACLVRSACVCLCVCRYGMNDEKGGRTTCKADMNQEASRRVRCLVLSACVSV